MTSQDLELAPQPDASSMGSVLVIGAGFGGIAAALRMRAKGFEVTLVDRLQAIGGRAQVFERGGFRHDAGPTVITAPFLFDELFELFGEDRSDYVEFRALDPWYRFYFHGGRQFDYRRTVEDTNAEIRKFEPADVAGYARLLETSKAIFEVGFEKLADQNHAGANPQLAAFEKLSFGCGDCETPPQTPVAASGVFDSSAAGGRQSFYHDLDLCVDPLP
jgi:phytoene desaturase